jgi:hypothetical protein
VTGVYLAGWAVTRLLFLFFWTFAKPLGEATVWLKQKALA